MFYVLLALLVISTTIVSIITKNRIYVLINSGILIMLIYELNEELWLLSLVLLLFTYLIEYVIYRRTNANTR